MRSISRRFLDLHRSSICAVGREWEIRSRLWYHIQYWSATCDTFMFTSAQLGGAGTKGESLVLGALRWLLGRLSRRVLYSVTTQISYCERGEEKSRTMEEMKSDKEREKFSTTVGNKNIRYSIHGI